jgi:hypothetical protein
VFMQRLQGADQEFAKPLTDARGSVDVVIGRTG